MSFLFDWIHFHSLYLETIAVSRYPFLRLYKFLPLQSIKILPSHPTPTPYPPFPLVCEARGGRRPSLPTLASQSAGEGLGGEEAGRVGGLGMGGRVRSKGLKFLSFLTKTSV